MSRARAIVGRPRWRTLGAGALAAAGLVLVLAVTLLGARAAPRAAAQPGGGEPTVQTDDSVPASNVTMIGSTPAEAGAGAYETWGIGEDASSQPVVVRYTQSQEGGWILGPGLQSESGQPLHGFQVDRPDAFSGGPSPLAGQLTADGAGVLAGSVEEGKRQVLLVRNPNDPENAFREVQAPSEADLEHGELLFSPTSAPLLAPLDESHERAGAFVALARERSATATPAVLHWDGETSEWSREPIELPSGASVNSFRALGIGATSKTNAWLLAQISAESVALFHREEESGGRATWQPVALRSGGEPGEPLTVEGEAIAIPDAENETNQTQALTVTEQGVWIDGERPEVKASTTVFFKPEGEGHGPSQTAWCSLERSPAGTAPCEQPELPEPLPTGPSRSIAWANSSSPFGERVITGLREGMILRLEGNTFELVPALGASPSSTPGATFGAAFSNPKEGWLGNDQLPVHFTLEPAPSRLSPWPVSFRHALVAAAPQPGVTPGALTSQVLAVGDRGEVARYEPGEGWLPESLLGPNGQHEEEQLRAVAWPTPNRAYAVGSFNPKTNSAQMWLWRGETGLWEPDPAMPDNFDGSLLGIAFEPNNPARGYAVGESGVLLGYGKTWTQEPYPAEPPCPASLSSRCTWEHASFTSVAFAGSEAIVAYRLLPSISSETYVGGLIVNNGSGWHIDQGAAQAMGSGVPWAVAGLPDGGAAFDASGVLYERENAGASWQAVSTPFPGGGEPGSISLFRENGALRAIGAGSPPNTYQVESVAEAPPGLPPTRIEAYPLATNDQRGLLRQTATGWSDEQHELTNAGEPAGHWKYYDQTYQPDPIATVLVDENGSEGWAIGGYVELESHEGLLDTSDIARYRGESVAPLGAGTSSIPSDPTEIVNGTKTEKTAYTDETTFAIGGNAQCASPCAARADAKIGPDVWLEKALQRAGQISGVEAFVYTGPRLVSPSAINGPKTQAAKIPYKAELARYAQILSTSPKPADVYAVATPTDLDEAGSEGEFLKVFDPEPPESEPFPWFGGAHPCGSQPTAGCQGAYYAFEKNGVRVIVLDDTADVDSTQREWLEGELLGAKDAPRPQPAIVVGNADLQTQIAAGNYPEAKRVAEVLVGDGASAYFFDSPEENIEETLSTRQGSIKTFGSGTLGYVSFTHETTGEFLGASGFLLASINLAEPRKNNVANVHVRLIPNIEELALEAEQGTLLRRSQAAQFEALARRPRAGNRSEGGGEPRPNTDMYIPIPSYCTGSGCTTRIEPEFEFHSSETSIGNFVKPNLVAEPKGKEPELTPSTEKTIPDSRSGLFCAFNKGTTTVTISTGGLSASLPVTVQAGSVRRPCGTEPANKPAAAAQQAAPATPAPAPTPAPTSTPPTSSSPLPPVPPAPAAPAVVVPPTVVHPHKPATPPNFFLPAVVATPLLAFVPAPVPTPARPTPPTGTSAVTSPVEAPEKEEEEEGATESVGNNALAYRAHEHEPSPLYILGIVALAAFAGASARRRPRRGRRELRVAPATLSTMRAQRRMGRGRARRP